MLPKRLSYLSDLPGAGTSLCVERLWMIKLMVVGFCHIETDASPGSGRRV